MRRCLIILLILIFSVVLILAQGLAINVVMRGLRKEIDERFVAGRLFWKPALPLLFRSARGSVVPCENRMYNFAPPFRKFRRK